MDKKLNFKTSSTNLEKLKKDDQYKISLAESHLGTVPVFFLLIYLLYPGGILRIHVNIWLKNASAYALLYVARNSRFCHAMSDLPFFSFTGG